MNADAGFRSVGRRCRIRRRYSFGLFSVRFETEIESKSWNLTKLIGVLGGACRANYIGCAVDPCAQIYAMVWKASCCCDATRSLLYISSLCLLSLQSPRLPGCVVTKYPRYERITRGRRMAESYKDIQGPVTLLGIVSTFLSFLYLMGPDYYYGYGCSSP